MNSRSSPCRCPQNQAQHLAGTPRPAITVRECPGSDICTLVMPMRPRSPLNHLHPQRRIALKTTAWSATADTWAWEDTARALRERAHTALPVTLTGLGERADEATSGTGLDTHVEDIVAFVEQHDLHDVTLVAHSYAAAPVSGAAGRLGSRLERLVYLDSAPFAEGMRMLDLMPAQAAEQQSKQVAEHEEGWRLPMPAFEVLGSFGSLDGLGLPVASSAEASLDPTVAVRGRAAQDRASRFRW